MRCCYCECAAMVVRIAGFGRDVLLCGQLRIWGGFGRPVLMHSLWKNRRLHHGPKFGNGFPHILIDASGQRAQQGGAEPKFRPLRLEGEICVIHEIRIIRPCPWLLWGVTRLANPRINQSGAAKAALERYPSTSRLATLTRLASRLIFK